MKNIFILPLVILVLLISCKTEKKVEKSVVEKDITILVSTPYMDEAVLCDRVALIQQGNILKMDTPLAIEQQFEKFLYTIKTEKVYPVIKVLREDLELPHSYTFGQEIHIYSERELDLKNVQNRIEVETGQILSVEQGPATIEDVFMDLMVSSGLTEKVSE